MHSNQNERLFENVIKTSNDLVRRLRENRVRLKESLVSKLNEENVFRKEAVGTVNVPTETNKSKCSWKYRDDCDSKNMKSARISLDCPICLTKLGINVRSSSHTQLNDQVKVSIIAPGESGDKSEDDTCKQIVNYSPLRTAPSQNLSMSYTVLKGCTSSPDSTLYAKGKAYPIMKSRSHRFQVGKKQTCASYKSFPTQACQRRRDQNNRQLVRSQSFTLAPALELCKGQVTNNYSRVSLGVMDSSIQMRESIVLARTTCLSPSQNFQVPSDLQSVGNFTFDTVLNEGISLVGIDTIDPPVSLYDSVSSSTISCQYDEEKLENDSTDVGNCAVSEPAPNTQSQEILPQQQVSVDGSTIRLPDAPTNAVCSSDHQISTTVLYDSSSKDVDYADHQTLTIHLPGSPEKEVEYVAHQKSTTTMSPNGNDTDPNHSIPRPDLYKDCFTLLLEKWFG